MAGKRVLVVGFGNTSADIAGTLVNIAEKVYLSHRHGAIVVSEESVDHVNTSTSTADE